MSRVDETASERILVLTPTGRDAPMICERIVASGLSCEICPDLGSLLEQISAGAGAAVVAQEALTMEGAEALLAALGSQEPWSDIPVLLLVDAAPAKIHRSDLLGPGPALFERANVTLLQRPQGVQLFLSSVAAAVRARRRQYEMRDLYRELERAVQLSDMFVGILGHDLRTPIGSIKIAAEIIVRLSTDVRALRPAGRILTAANRMTRLIEQLLDFARARRGQGIPIHPGLAHLGELCRQAVQEIEDAHPEAAFHFHDDGELSGFWDADRMGQVVTNLVGNAVQHGAAGTPITIEVDGTNASTVRLRIHNTGTIPPEAIPTLFDAFTQAPGDQAESLHRSGLGLGLFIAREITRAHGGEIAVRSSDDRTTFEVTLPRDARPAGPDAFAVS